MKTNVTRIKAYRYFILWVEGQNIDNVPSATDTNIDQIT